MNDDLRNNESFDFLRKAKTHTIHTLAVFGKKHPVIKYPVFVLTVVFIFVYNVFFHMFMQFHMREKLSRALAFVMCFILVFTGSNITSFARSAGDDGSGETA